MLLQEHKFWFNQRKQSISVAEFAISILSEIRKQLWGCLATGLGSLEFDVKHSSGYEKLLNFLIKASAARRIFREKKGWRKSKNRIFFSSFLKIYIEDWIMRNFQNVIFLRMISTSAWEQSESTRFLIPSAFLLSKSIINYLNKYIIQRKVQRWIEWVRQEGCSSARMNNWIKRQKFRTYSACWLWLFQIFSCALVRVMNRFEKEIYSSRKNFLVPQKEKVKWSERKFRILCGIIHLLTLVKSSELLMFTVEKKLRIFQAYSSTSWLHRSLLQSEASEKHHCSIVCSTSVSALSVARQVCVMRIYVVLCEKFSRPNFKNFTAELSLSRWRELLSWFGES